VSRLCASLGAVVEGKEGGDFLLPEWTSRVCSNADIALAVGGVALFLEYTDIAFEFPFSVYIDGISRGGVDLYFLV
jgi:hypothetical protein